MITHSVVYISNFIYMCLKMARGIISILPFYIVYEFKNLPSYRNVDEDQWGDMVLNGNSIKKPVRIPSLNNHIKCLEGTLIQG